MAPPRRTRKSHSPSILKFLASDISIVLMVTLVLLGVYLIDTVTPLGEPVWLLYFIPLVIAYWSDRYYAIPAVAIVTLVFLIGGFIASPQGVAVSQAIVYRLTFFLTYICLAIVMWALRRRQILEDHLI